MTDINNKEIIFGKRPVRRTNRKPGQSEWYYLDPRCAETFSDMKQIDVENEYSPNPYANEIQNYLYNNDEYNYKLLYGDNPPPAIQAQNYPKLREDKRNFFNSSVENFVGEFIHTPSFLIFIVFITSLSETFTPH